MPMLRAVTESVVVSGQRLDPTALLPQIRVLLLGAEDASPKPVGSENAILDTEGGGGFQPPPNGRGSEQIIHLATGGSTEIFSRQLVPNPPGTTRVSETGLAHLRRRDLELLSGHVGLGHQNLGVSRLRRTNPLFLLLRMLAGEQSRLTPRLRPPQVGQFPQQPTQGVTLSSGQSEVRPADQHLGLVVQVQSRIELERRGLVDAVEEIRIGHVVPGLRRPGIRQQVFRRFGGEPGQQIVDRLLRYVVTAGVPDAHQGAEQPPRRRRPLANPLVESVVPPVRVVLPCDKTQSHLGRHGHFPPPVHFSSEIDASSPCWSMACRSFAVASSRVGILARSSQP